MGVSQSTNESQIKINFDDVKWVVENKTGVLINTLIEGEQNCLIRGTMPINKEELLINKHLQSEKNIHIIIYGRNSSDETTLKKYEQLTKLGFYNVYIYLGGLFEWLLLQDIYGNELFHTTTAENGFLKSKSPKSIFNHYLK